MAWSDPPHFVTGHKITAAWLNSYVSDNLDWLHSGRMAWKSVMAPSFSTTSTSPVDWGGTGHFQVNFDKEQDDTQLTVYLYTTFFFNTSSGTAIFYVNDGVTNWAIRPRLAITPIVVQECYYGMRDFGGAAGSYTLTLRVSAHDGGTFQTSGNAYAMMRVKED